MTRCRCAFFVRFAAIVLLCAMGALPARSQRAYFVDGYHGGVWGHYPRHYTRFMLDKLEEYPAWKLNLEIEPETFDWVKQVDPEGYGRFSAWLADPATASRIEFVNPAYGQPYLFNISGESIIRHLDLGIRQLRLHFPSLDFLTYSSEEPCFTSALPQLLRSFGFRYASLKNPNTCWGGYVRAHGHDLVQWQGPDGTAIPTAPRYGVEALKPGSTWETIGNTNSREFIGAALRSGVRFPVGMCLQDAGWYNGPWLGDNTGGYQPNKHVVWREYFAEVLPQVDAPIWRLSQEDIQVSLVWGAQVLQRVAQQARRAESRILLAERVAAMDWFFDQRAWPGATLDRAWKNLMLAQHHDCWIVPYNKVDSLSWAGKTAYWTGQTLAAADTLLAVREAAPDSNGTPLTVTNALPYRRTDIVAHRLAATDSGEGWEAVDGQGRTVPAQWVEGGADGYRTVLFVAEVPAMGRRTYRLVRTGAARDGFVHVRREGPCYIVESDRYRIAVDTARGGVITSLKATGTDATEWVDAQQGEGLNELRGFFPEEQRFRSSAEYPATVRVLENGPVRFRMAVHTQLAGHPVVQELRLVSGQARIDFGLAIEWRGQPQIAQFIETDYRPERRRKAFYSDRHKLLALFPLALTGQRVAKNAPFDVTESRLDDTFFGRWDSIKNNIVLDWVSVTDSPGQQGMALFTDHTTSYVHAQGHPLGLTVQYAGKALWGKEYGVEGSTRMAYGLLPHDGAWDKAGLWQEDDYWKAPLVASATAGRDTASMLAFDKPGYQVSGLVVDGDDLLVRVFNAAGDATPLEVSLPRKPARAIVEELDGRLTERLEIRPVDGNRHAFRLAMPRFGVRTVRIGFDDMD